MIGDTVSQGRLAVLPRVGAVVGDEGRLGGFTAVVDWRRPALGPPKDRDFALALGPVVVTPDELAPEGLAAIVRVDGQERLRASFGGFDWEEARAHAAEGTSLRAGDLLLGAPLELVDGLAPGSAVELEVDGVGVLTQSVAP